jgi:Skp family chaperone for outer membrane proteins
MEAKILAEKRKLDSLKESIESRLATYTPKQRETKSKEFQKKVETFQKLVRETEESFMKEQEGETNKIFALIEKTVSEYGKANNAAIIVMKKDIMFVGGGTEVQDLTGIILKAVNDAWKKR